MQDLEHYGGREHANVKHHILTSYLKRLVMILGRNRAEICYVDTFAGPWGTEDSEFRGTSFRLAAEVLEDARQTLARDGFSVRFRALFIESDSKPFERLSAFVAAGYGQIEMECRRGDFVDLRDEILEWLGPSAFTFFFIDPKGWTEVEPSILGPLLARPNSECLINFMYDFFNRVTSQAGFAGHVQSFVGDVAHLEGMSPTQRQQEIVRMYRARLREAREALSQRDKTWTAAFPVQDAQRNRVKYYLVYVTGHPLGVIKFGECADETRRHQIQLQSLLHEQRRETQTGVTDMFGSGEIGPHQVQNDLLTGAAIDEAEQYWRAEIGEDLYVANREALANAIDMTGSPPSVHQAALGRLIDAGVVVNRATKRARPRNPVNFEKKEALLLVRQTPNVD